MENTELAKMREDLSSRAQETVKVTLPAKVLEIDKMLSELTEVFRNKKINMPSCEQLKGAVSADMGTKKRKLEDGNNGKIASNSLVVESNQEIVRIIKGLTKKITELIELLSVVKTWIQLNIPRIDTGSNFGVSVQEDCVSELARVEDSGFTVLDSTSKYFNTRAKLAHKMTKHPLVMDYYQSLIECDETQYIVLRMTLIDMRNNYAILHDLVTKNLEKILKPRNSELAVAMY